MDTSTSSLWTSPFPIEGIIITMFYRNIFNANSEDLDQMPRSASSNLGLLCLSMSLLWDARHKWVKNICVIIIYVIVIGIFVS